MTDPATREYNCKYRTRDGQRQIINVEAIDPPDAVRLSRKWLWDHSQFHRVDWFLMSIEHSGGRIQTMRDSDFVTIEPAKPDTRNPMQLFLECGSLAQRLEEHRADCGCRLVRTDKRAAMFMCPMHQRAKRMAEALAVIVAVGPDNIAAYARSALQHDEPAGPTQPHDEPAAPVHPATVDYDSLVIALRKIQMIIGNVNHCIGHGPNSAEHRGGMLDTIRQIADDAIAKIKPTEPGPQPAGPTQPHEREPMGTINENEIAWDVCNQIREGNTLWRAADAFLENENETSRHDFEGYVRVFGETNTFNEKGFNDLFTRMARTLKTIGWSTPESDDPRSWIRSAKASARAAVANDLAITQMYDDKTKPPADGPEPSPKIRRSVMIKALHIIAKTGPRSNGFSHWVHCAQQAACDALGISRITDPAPCGGWPTDDLPDEWPPAYDD